MESRFLSYCSLERIATHNNKWSAPLPQARLISKPFFPRLCVTGRNSRLKGSCFVFIGLFFFFSSLAVSPLLWPFLFFPARRMCDVMAQSFFVVSQQQLVLFISANIWTPPMLIFLSISLFLTCGNGWTTSFDLFFFRLLTCLSGGFVWNHVFKVKVETVFFDIYLELEMTSSTSIFTTSFVGEFVSRRTNEKFKGWNKETGLGSVIQLVPYMVVAFFLRRRKK